MIMNVRSIVKAERDFLQVLVLNSLNRFNSKDQTTNRNRNVKACHHQEGFPAELSNTNPYHVVVLLEHAGPVGEHKASVPGKFLQYFFVQRS